MHPSRRRFLTRLSATVPMISAATRWTPGVMAEQLAATASMTEGPFYPDQLPLDTDNDLVIINDQLTPAVGEVTYLSGEVLGRDGKPIDNAHVEIWQCDANGIYRHPRDRRVNDLDSNFQSYGRFITDRRGRYFFRTIKPVRYTGRTPHIHMAVSKNGHRILTTQLLIRGEPQNQKDGLFQRIAPEQRRTVLANFVRTGDSGSNTQGNRSSLAVPQWDVTFNLVLGQTADEAQMSDAARG